MKQHVNCHLKLNGFAIVFLVLSLLLCVPSCGHRHHRSPGGRSERRVTEKYENGRNNERRSTGGGCSRRREITPDVPQPPKNYQPIYFMQNVVINQGISLQEALYQFDPKAQEIEQKYDVGGTKLIAEMSADVGGIYYSRNSNTNININILSLEQLKLHVDYSKTSIYQQIINQQIVLNSSSVGILQKNESSLVALIVDFLDALQTGQIVVQMSFANITNHSVVCEIKQGQMLEIANENVQNLVVAETVKFSIAANQRTEISVHAYCASHHRGDPSGSRVRFTPYILNASSSVYESQINVWNYIENRY